MRHLISAMIYLSLCNSAHAVERTVVFVLFDGLAPAMIDAANTPNLDRIRDEGSWTHEMKPVFPTISGVNHASYTTGCTPGKHGIVSNVFHDPVKGRFNGERDADWRTGCETIWESVERQGGIAATLGFLGNYSSSRGPTARYAPREHSWQDSPDDSIRTDQVIDLLNMEEDDRPNLIAAYYQGPDWVAHWQGTTGDETLAAVNTTDHEIGRLMAAIAALPEDREVILFIAADHSMIDVSAYLNIGRVMFKHDIEGRYAADGAHAFIYLDDAADTQTTLKAFRGYDILSAYDSGNFPDYFDAGDSGRAGDILIVLDQPYWIADAEEFPVWARWLGLTVFWPEILELSELSAGIKATHGYPPETPNMGTIFYSWGAAIKPSHNIDKFTIIDAAPTALDWMGMDAGQDSSGVVRAGMFQP